MRKRWTDDEIKFLEEHWSNKSTRWIAKQLNRTNHSVRHKANARKMYKESYKEYAVYSGETLLAVGTAKECAEALGVTPKTIIYYATPTHKKMVEKGRGKRRVAFKLEEDE